VQPLCAARGHEQRRHRARGLLARRARLGRGGRALWI
jgi:hypothetical protein